MKTHTDKFKSLCTRYVAAKKARGWSQRKIDRQLRAARASLQRNPAGFLQWFTTHVAFIEWQVQRSKDS